MTEPTNAERLRTLLAVLPDCQVLSVERDLIEAVAEELEYGANCRRAHGEQTTFTPARRCAAKEAEGDGR